MYSGSGRHDPLPKGGYGVSAADQRAQAGRLKSLVHRKENAHHANHMVNLASG